MSKRKAFLIVQSILWIVLAALVIAAVIALYREGLAVKAEDPLAWIFTRDILAARFRPIQPLLYVTVALTVIGWILRIRDEKGLKPVKGGKVQNRAASGVRTVRTVLLVAAVCLIVAGVFNGSARDVFGKAVKICTECVGLG